MYERSLIIIKITNFFESFGFNENSIYILTKKNIGNMLFIKNDIKVRL